MSQINVSKLTFCYDGSFDNVFENVSFSIDTNWKLGFCGRNGKGKTTFLNLLMGKFEYSGKITASVKFEYFPYAVQDKTRQTIDIVDEIASDYIHWELLREIAKLSVKEDVLYRPFDTLSNGEQTKVLLSALFLKENSFLLIDEPTNHLDLVARQLVAKYLNSKEGFILVSHDRAFLDVCVDHILSINKASIEVQQGNFSSWYSNKQLQDNFETHENQKLKKNIADLEKSALQTQKWSDKVEKSKNKPLASGLSADKGYIGHKAAKMMKRSKNSEQRKIRAIEEKEKLLRNIDEKEDLKLHPLVFHYNRLVECKDLSLFYGDRQVCDAISFTINQGDRIALSGKNGCGKSSILKLICGEEISYTGEFYKAKNLKISYISQDASFLSGSLSNFEQENELNVSLFRAILRKLDFARVQFEKDMKDYSAGQKKKVLIARSLCQCAHLYIWDEPLNYIDILSRMQIEQLLKDFKPTLLFVEHDKTFCEKVATKTIEL